MTDDALKDFDRQPPEGALPSDRGRPYGPGYENLKPRARAIYDRLENTAHIQPSLEANYLIKGWFDRGGLSTLYGPPNVGKSFLALDIAHHVQEGTPWFGRRVSQGTVMYVAAETGSAFDNRVAALGESSFWLLKGDFSFLDAQPLSEAMEEIARAKAERFDLIIFDTRSRIMSGHDENAGPDIARLLQQMDGLRRVTGAHVMLVDHVGKDRSKGMRCHSSLEAAIDTAVSVEAEDVGGFPLITATSRKQRDQRAGLSITYSLKEVELGKDQDGDPVTSCIVQPEEGERHA